MAVLKRKPVRLLAMVTAWLLVMQVAGPVLAETKINDVPPDHWAYQAVVSLVEKGYLGLFEDGTFQGTKPVDRYTLASVVARLLSQVENGRISPSEEDLKTLRSLSTEFRTELAALAKRAEGLENRVTATEKQLTITREELAKVTARNEEIGQKTEILEKQFQDALVAQREGSQLQMRTMEESLASLRDEFTSYRRTSEEKISSLQQTNRLLTAALAALALVNVIFLTR